MKILLIRHGESEADLLNVHEGRADYSLTKKGQDQALCMAIRVKKEFNVEKIWSSTLKRAEETAKVLRKQIGCEIEFLDELQEHNNGDLAGKPFSEVKHPVNLLPHEKVGTFGESKIEFRMRAEQVLSRILDKSKGFEEIAIVSHGGMISRIIESFLQLPVIHNSYFLTGDTGIHLLEINKEGRLVLFTNNTNHLLTMDKQ
ncbi:histidine phosphatase family protein [Rummeliibacillus sp. TYF005]|uniref:histidine phosphatase family protein n=1 Tax=unclassified Rummeliibacillus TaxID=2622809 RepID=UPI000E670669|nr:MULTISPECIES: histidine phosphatase family protein [unclassified Rummeliibacillus]RIJ63247.1 histidine phosphatase family protein [Rummeliibacillus sp. POC4]RPJ96088.1 histidine phosphatase family protein [Rummeliibacillus sp. TYF005]